MKLNKAVIRKREVIIGIVATLTLGLSILSAGACRRHNAETLRLASTTDPGTSNAPINNPPGNVSSAPGISYADIVSRVSPAVITIIVTKVTSEIAEKLGLPNQNGVLVAQVQPGSAADRAGMQENDVITNFNGTTVNDSNTFRNLVAATPPGTEVTLTVLRGGREQQIRATLGEFTPQPPRQR